MTKRVKNLWQQITSMENLEKAFKISKRHKGNYKHIIRFEKNLEKNLKAIQKMLLEKTYKTSKYTTQIIHEPKEREIFKLPHNPDKIIQIAVINILEPYIIKWLIKDTYACIKKRGIHKASERTMQFVKRNKYCLQCDVKKFYPSIDHDILYKIMEKKIKDPDLLWLLKEVIYSIGGGKNAPIGSLFSQHFGNLYLDRVDRYVKEVLQIKDYERYCDDFLLYGNDKKELWDAKYKIIEFCRKELKLELKRADLFPTSRGVDFMGYRHFPKGYILLRKSTAKRTKKALPKVLEKYEKGIIKHDKFMSIVMSIDGWVSRANTKNFREKIGLDKLKELAMVDFAKICDERDKNLRKVKGDKVDIKDWLGKPIKISYFKITKSSKKQGTNCMSVEFYYDDKPYMFFTGSPNLMYLIDKYLSPEMIERGETLDATVVRKDGMLVLA